MTLRSTHGSPDASFHLKPSQRNRCALMMRIMGIFLAMPMAVRATAGTCGLDSACASASASSKALLQRSMRSDDANALETARESSSFVQPPPRHELWNMQLPLSTDYVVQEAADAKHRTDHNKCNSNSPDGRIFLCGESYRHVRYFKFENLSFTEGLPRFDDGAWSLWKKDLQIWWPWRASLCFPNWKKPFEVLPNGNHLYAMYSNSDQWRNWLNVTVANPMTPEAEIVDVVQGDYQRMSNKLPRYGYHTGAHM